MQDAGVERYCDEHEPVFFGKFDEFLPGSLATSGAYVPVNGHTLQIVDNG